MAGNTPNVAPNNVQDQSYEQTQESTITQIKSAVSDKLNRLCDTIKGCAASGALAATLAVATPNVATAQEAVDPNTVVVIEGKNYTYQQLYDMWVEERREILRKIPSRGEREHTISYY